MIIKSVRLENIRSYLSETIDFPSGSTLLSGDIGSGKSTILLAIEFALFGVKRADLSGSALLRHGKKSGSVELVLDIDGKEIIIKRALKRGKDDIKQEAGYIISNGIKKEGTHIELKSQVLEMLGYPTDLLTKSKDIVFRYTVYTPQEAMKQILLEEKDARLDTLRKVFNIDKYKRIRENSEIFIRELKERRKNFEGKISDLELKLKQRELKEKEAVEMQKQVDELLPKLETSKAELAKRKKDITQKEDTIKEYNRLKKEIELSELSLKNILERRKKNQRDMEILSADMAKLKQDLDRMSISGIKSIASDLQKKANESRELSEMIISLNRSIAESEARKKHSTETKQKIARIDQCPTCLQKVEESHKKRIHEKEDSVIKELELMISQCKEKERAVKAKAEESAKEQEELRKKQSEIKVQSLKQESLKEKEQRNESLSKEQDTLKQEIGKINMKKLELGRRLDAVKDVESEYIALKRSYETALLEERKLEIGKRELEVQREHLLRYIQELESEITEKEKYKLALARLAQFQNWLEKYFISLMNTMERHVMLQVYSEFNDLFRQWFSILIEDETMGVRLDDEFAPIIEQNGYETEIGNLSGGEKTAVALAYRLALNNVINDMIGTIKTKDIIILDEPTDGFSTEQLDQVRIVLEQLSIKQVIIVSHESKIESFVDNVIRITKDEHVSEIN